MRHGRITADRSAAEKMAKSAGVAFDGYRVMFVVCQALSVGTAPPRRLRR